MKKKTKKKIARPTPGPKIPPPKSNPWDMPRMRPRIGNPKLRQAFKKKGKKKRGKK